MNRNVPIDENIGSRTNMYTVRQLTDLMKVSEQAVLDLHATSVSEILWKEICSGRYLLMPFAGLSAKTVVETSRQPQVTHRITGLQSQTDRGTRKLLHVPQAFDTEFYRTEPAPAWIAFPLSDTNNDPTLQPLKTSHMLQAALLSQEVGDRPLRSVVEYRREVDTDSNGKNLGVTDYGNQYWRTSDVLHPKNQFDHVIVGDTLSSGLLLTHTESFKGLAPVAKGIIIPAGPRALD